MRKVIAFVTNDRPFGVAINALAHMSAGLAAKLAEQGDPLKVSHFKDGKCSEHSGILLEDVEVRFVSPEAIRRQHQAALDLGLDYVDFVESMTGDTYMEQMARTRETAERDLHYYGLIVVGDEILDQLIYA